MKRMKMAESTTPRVSLPDDLVTEVLLRLPARSIARFRCTCKSWNVETSSPGFMDRHHVLAAAKLAFVPLALVHVFSGRLWLPGAASPCPPGPFKCTGCPVIIDSKPCRGVVLIQRKCTTGYYSLLNPTTGEIIRLPPSHDENLCRYSTITGVGFDSADGVYKVVKVCPYLGNLHCKVLTLGDARGWRTLSAGDQLAAAFGFTENTRIDSHQDPVFANGYLHWSFKTHYLYIDQPHGVLSFSLADESFRWVLQPPFNVADLEPFDGRHTHREQRQIFRGLGWRIGSNTPVVVPVGTTLTELDGRICLVRDVRLHNDVRGQFEVWKLQDYETGTWSLDYRIDLTGCYDEIKQLLMRPCRVVPIKYLPGNSREKRKLLLATTQQTMHVYDPNTSTLETVAAAPHGSSTPGLGDSVRLLLYQESLVRLPGMEQAKGEIEIVKLGSLVKSDML